MTFSIRKILLSAAAVAMLASSFTVTHVARAETTMEIQVGSWGYGADRKDVKESIAKLCNGKSSCTFMVKNESLGLTAATDPSPGNDKGLMVFWKCGETVNKDAFPQNKDAVLKCK